MPIITTLQEIEKEFEEKCTKDTYNGGFLSYGLNADAIKSFLKQSFIKYLQSEVEKLEKTRDEYCKEDVVLEINRPYDWHGYSHAISDQITHLQAQIEELQ